MLVPGLAAVIIGSLLAWLGRRSENTALLKTGLRADAEIVASSVTPFGHRFRYTTVTYRFLPAGYSQPLEVTTGLEGVIDIEAGKIMPVCYLAGYPFISLLVPYASKQDASRSIVSNSEFDADATR
jgi:hypothetical protein